MEFPWRINSIKFFCHGYQKGLCFKIINQEFNNLNEKFVAKSN